MTCDFFGKYVYKDHTGNNFPNITAACNAYDDHGLINIPKDTIEIE